MKNRNGPNNSCASLLSEVSKTEAMAVEMGTEMAAAVAVSMTNN